MSDTKDWPMVPVDPECVPEGYEAVRVGFSNPNEWVAIELSDGVKPLPYVSPVVSRLIRLIIRPIPEPIRLPTQIVPSGWWVGKDDDGEVWIYKRSPKKQSCGWGCSMLGDSDYHQVPEPIAAQLPAEYLALPWDQSLLQQTEGM
jgi:hypothetical protein